MRMPELRELDLDQRNIYTKSPKSRVKSCRAPIVSILSSVLIHDLYRLRNWNPTKYCRFGIMRLRNIIPTPHLLEKSVIDLEKKR